MGHHRELPPGEHTASRLREWTLDALVLAVALCSAWGVMGLATMMSTGVTRLGVALDVGIGTFVGGIVAESFARGRSFLGGALAALAFAAAGWPFWSEVRQGFAPSGWLGYVVGAAACAPVGMVLARSLKLNAVVRHRMAQNDPFLRLAEVLVGTLGLVGSVMPPAMLTDFREPGPWPIVLGPLVFFAVVVILARGKRV